MKKQYVVYVKNVEVKRYPYKIQAIVYCFLNGYVSSGRGLYFLHPDARIKKVYAEAIYRQKLLKGVNND